MTMKHKEVHMVAFDNFKLEYGNAHERPVRRVWICSDDIEMKCPNPHRSPWWTTGIGWLIVLLIASLIILLTGCVVNENGETDTPPPCETAVMDTSDLKPICQNVDLVRTEGTK